MTRAIQPRMETNDSNEVDFLVPYFGIAFSNLKSSMTKPLPMS
jgi:hypothetical protein